MALRFTTSFVLDVDEWDESIPLDLYMRTVLETLSMKVASVTEHTRGCDLYGVMPVYRADGERIGSWELWNVSDAESREITEGC